MWSFFVCQASAQSHTRAGVSQYEGGSTSLFEFQYKVSSCLGLGLLEGGSALGICISDVKPGLEPIVSSARQEDHHVLVLERKTQSDPLFKASSMHSVSGCMHFCRVCCCSLARVTLEAQVLRTLSWSACGLRSHTFNKLPMVDLLGTGAGCAFPSSSFSLSYQAPFSVLWKRSLFRNGTLKKRNPVRKSLAMLTTWPMMFVNIVAPASPRNRGTYSWPTSSNGIMNCYRLVEFRISSGLTSDAQIPKPLGGHSS